MSRCRSFIFSTATPPVWLFAMESALDILEAEPWRRRRVLELARRLRRSLCQGGLEVGSAEGPIVPVVLGEVARALAAAAALQTRGYDVRAIRPPTVPAGTSRLRLSVHAGHREEEIDGLASGILAAVGLAAIGAGGEAP